MRRHWTGYCSQGPPKHFCLFPSNVNHSMKSKWSISLNTPRSQLQITKHQCRTLPVKEGKTDVLVEQCNNSWTPRAQPGPSSMTHSSFLLPAYESTHACHAFIADTLEWTLSASASHLTHTSKSALQKGWHNFAYFFLLSASTKLQWALQLKYRSGGPHAVKAKANCQVRTVNTQIKAANGNYTYNIINCSTYTTNCNWEVKEHEPLGPQWGSQEARHRTKESLRPASQADLQTGSTKYTERNVEIWEYGVRFLLMWKITSGQMQLLKAWVPHVQLNLGMGWERRTCIYTAHCTDMHIFLCSNTFLISITSYFKSLQSTVMQEDNGGFSFQLQNFDL